MHVSKNDTYAYEARSGQDISSSPASHPLSHSARVFVHTPDPEIWEAFRGGHEGAFAYLYETYFDALYNYGCHLVGNSGPVEDSLQDLFIDLRQRRAHLSQVQHIKPYLFCAFRRLLIKQMEKERKRANIWRLFSFSAVAFAEDTSTSATPDMPHRLAIRFSDLSATSHSFTEGQLTEVQARYLEQALAQLPKRQKEALFHFFYEGFTYAEVADVMELGSAKAARNLVYKALGSLRQHADNQLPGWLLAALFLMCM